MWSVLLLGGPSPGLNYAASASSSHAKLSFAFSLFELIDGRFLPISLLSYLPEIETCRPHQEYINKDSYGIPSIAYSLSRFSDKVIQDCILLKGPVSSALCIHGGGGGIEAPSFLRSVYFIENLYNTLIFKVF